MNKRSSILTGVLAIFAATLVSCVDEEWDNVLHPSDIQTRAPQEVTTPGGLEQQADGTWLSKNCRVPIVGPGRIVSEINSSTVNVVGVGNGNLSNIVDTDIDNGCAIPAVIKAEIECPVVSVKDINHIYAAGQKVGFVYRDTEDGGAKLLSLDLLKSATLTTYLNGKKQESIRAEGENSVVKLDLLTLNSGKKTDRVIALEVTKPFDEVCMGFSGVSAEAVAKTSLFIKYAFVGENPEIRATSEHDFSYYWTGGNPGITKSGKFLGVSEKFTDISDKEALKIVDDNAGNYAVISAGVLGLIAESDRATVNFKRTIPAGTEIGYTYSAGELLNLSLFSKQYPSLTTFNETNREVEELKSANSLLSVGLGNNAKHAYISMVTEKECSQLRIIRPKKGVLLPGLLDISTMNVYYAYAREAVKTDPANYFTFGSDTTYNYTYRLPKPETGNVQYYVLSSPYGTSPSVEDGKLTGMQKDGAYRIQAFYTSTDGRQVSHVATIYHKSNDAQTGCNKYITAKSHGAYASEALNSNGICLLCLFNGSNNLNNVVDAVDGNYATVNQFTSVLDWAPLASFTMNKPVEAAGQIRTGFIVQANSKLLDLSALSHYKIRLYNNGTLVGDNTSDNKSNVKLGLLGFDRSKVRLSVETDQSFDRIELWRKGVADVLTSMRIYSIFYEPTTCNAAAHGGGCMEMLTNMKDNLQMDYEKTKIDAGLLSVGSSFTDIENILDGSEETGALLGSVLSADGSKIALKFNMQKGNQAVGIVLGGLRNLVDVSLSDVGVFKVFNDDNEVASTTKVDVLGANVLSSGGRTYIEVTPESDFNRIEYTTGGVELLKTSKICGVYIRPDFDGDGIPDCADDDRDGDKLGIDGDDFHTCYGSPLNIPLKIGMGTTEVSIYAYDEDKKENVRCRGGVAGKLLTIPANALPVGRYLLYLYTADGEYLLAHDVKATIHPQISTWKTNPVSAEWNNWENWKEGSPWKCTNVILPANAAYYPELKAGEGDYCKNIHFEKSAELLGIQYLTMGEMAFVDMALQGGRYYLISAPLQEMYTGDMFISPGTTWSKDKYFTPLGADNYVERRNLPVVYQHFWSGTALEKREDGTDIDVSTAKWSADFNAVKTKYALGQGFLMRAGDSSDRNSYTFRFPKTHDSYRFFRSNGSATDKVEKLNRNSTNIGKFAMSTPGSVTLENKEAGTTFLMGNPFMTHIDVSKFLAANSEIAEVRVFNGNSYDPTKDIESQTVSSTSDKNLLVAPMEAFFIILKDKKISLTVSLNGEMLTQKHKPTNKE